jgi:hypothetical protein
MAPIGNSFSKADTEGHLAGQPGGSNWRQQHV